jgi:cysteine-rich repeat protein
MRAAVGLRAALLGAFAVAFACSRDFTKPEAAPSAGTAGEQAGSSGAGGSGGAAVGSSGATGAGEGGEGLEGPGGTGAAAGHANEAGTGGEPQEEACGDRSVDPGEDCDDGNDVNTDGCVRCRFARCGDAHRYATRSSGNPNPLEECDDGDDDNHDGCTAECMLPGCGDGFINTGSEQCDDGATDNGDGCDHDCFVEPGWVCGTDEPTTCEDADECAESPDVCGPTIACDNVAGGFRCDRCREGYLGDAKHGCEPTVTLSSGNSFSCALPEVGGVHCWGISSLPVVTDAPKTGEFRALAAGYRHACAIRADGSLTCWGDTSAGQAPPAPPPGRFKSVACGAAHSCAVSVEGHAQCWGADERGNTIVPVGSYRAISTQETVTCALRADGRIRCFGDPDSQIMTSTGGSVFTSISTGATHACAVNAKGALYCWGNLSYGATLVPEGAYLSASAGYEHSCAITSQNHVACWGSSDEGQTSGPSSGTWRRVAAGDFHSCAIGRPSSLGSLDGTIDCWGERRRGGIPSPPGVFKER